MHQGTANHATNDGSMICCTLQLNEVNTGYARYDGDSN